MSLRSLLSSDHGSILSAGRVSILSSGHVFLCLLGVAGCTGGVDLGFDPRFGIDGGNDAAADGGAAQDSCEAITLSDLRAVETLLYTSSNISPAQGTVIADLFWIEVYDDVVGEIVLGAGVEANYNTCDHCLLIAEDSPSGDLVEATRLYFASSGVMRVAATSTPTEQFLEVVLEAVVFKEVTIDRENTGFLTTEVPDGRCLRIVNQALVSSLPE